MDNVSPPKNNPDKLYYFSRSADKPVGGGTNEYVADPAKYEGLNQVPHWRRMLSNFHVAPFRYVDGRLYNTVEHAFQAQKFKLTGPEGHWAYLAMSLDSGSEVAKGDGAAARKMRKAIILNNEQLKHWDGISGDVMKDIMRHKLKAYPELAKVLMMTKNAQLWHIRPRQTPLRSLYLEDLRAELAPH